MFTPVSSIKAAVGIASIGVANAGAAWTAAQSMPAVISENTFIPLGAALTVLGLTVTATYKLGKWMAMKEERDKQQREELEQIKERLEKLEVVL